MRIANLLLRIRDTLADPKKERWSDERLVRLIDEAQKDIAIHTHFFKNEADIYPTKQNLNLPDDVYYITRAHNGDGPIALLSYNDMDDMAHNSAMRHGRVQDSRVTKNFELPMSNWEASKGSKVTALIYDKRNMDSIRVYPIPDFTDSESDAFGVMIHPDATAGVFGVVNQGFGVTISATDSLKPIHLWYIAFPPAITGLSSILSLSTVWDTALKSYAIAHA